MSFLQMSVTGGVMILVITVLRALAINKLPKRTFLLLWGLALVRLLVPFSLPSSLSIYSLLAPKPQAAAAVPAARLLPVAVTQPLTASTQVFASAPASTFSVWSAVWLAGMALAAVLFAAAYLRAYREFQMSFPVETAFTRHWLQAHPIRRTISIRQSDRVCSPLTFGVLRPVILLPKNTDWEDAQSLQYVLAHELVHIRRFDTLSKLLLIAAVCVHWFNPLVWVLYILANRDIELSCDEAVIRQFGIGTRASYARVLIRMEETKRGFTPLYNHFSKNAIEERITAIMKTRKTTIASLLLAVTLITGTVTVFATSAKTDEDSKQPSTTVAQAVKAAGSGAAAVESAEPMNPSEEYLAAGITRQETAWYYQGKAVAGIYDDNVAIYMDDEAADGIYLNIQRSNSNIISDISVITRKQFRELVDRHMNLIETTYTESSLMSYINPDDGKTYYSFDDGQTFEPLTDAEFEALYPTPQIEWWTYDEYKAWLDNERVQLQSMLGEEGWTNGDGRFIWTQQKIDEAIALYESILADIKNGILYSKTLDGQDDVMVSFNPADMAIGTDSGK